MACTCIAAVVGSDTVWVEATAVGCRMVVCVATLMFPLCVCVCWFVCKFCVCVLACPVAAVCVAVWFVLATRGVLVYECLL